MKKLLVFILILIVLLGGGAAGGMYWFGMDMETKYQQALQQVSQQSGLITRGSGFTPGFMQSQARSLTLVPGYNLALTGDHTIAPGPIVISQVNQLLEQAMAGNVDGALLQFHATSTVKPMPKKGLPPDGSKLLARMPAATVTSSAGLLSGTVKVSVVMPAFKGVWRGTDMSWGEMTAQFEGNSDFSGMRLTGGSANLRLPADLVEELVRLRIRLDIEQLKQAHKLKPDEIKQLTPAAADLAVSMALPDYLKRYGILEVLSNARNAGVPLAVNMQPGRIKIGGVMLPR